MSRHRYYRNIKDDEYDHSDDIYGGSVEDDYSISPNTASLYIYNPNRTGAFFNESLDPTPDDFPDNIQASAIETPSTPIHSSNIERTDEMDVPTPFKDSSRGIMKRRPTPPWLAEDSPNPDIHDESSFNRSDMMNLNISDCGPANSATTNCPSRIHQNGEAEQSYQTKLLAGKVSLPPNPSSSEPLSVLPNHLEIPSSSSSTSVAPQPISGSSSPRCASPSMSRRNPEPSSVDRSPLVAAYKERLAERGGKETLDLIVIGHVDAGKSTLMGHLLCQVGSVSERQLQKYKWEAQKSGKASFAYAWVLDQTGEERTRGITMDIAQSIFETEHKRVTLLDAPGHRDFIPNMISGAVQADAAVLVVNATRGEFETGFEMGGQTREHALLVRSLGILQLVIAVNKMDTIDWNEERYNDICNRLSTFLRTIGLNSGVVFCPVSGLYGLNIQRRLDEDTSKGEPSLPSWYKGPTLLQCIDELTVPCRNLDAPFRFTISDIYKLAGTGNTVISGRVESGAIASLSATVSSSLKRVLCMPSGHVAQVKSILSSKTCDEMEEQGSSDENQSVSFAFSGDHVTLLLTGVDTLVVLTQGSMLCDPEHPITVSNKIKAKLLFFNVKLPITKGFQVLFHYQCQNLMATIKRLHSYVYKENKQETTKRNPRCIHKNGSAEVTIELERAICIECYQDYKSLGKFTLRADGQTLAGGTVTQILPMKS